MMPNVHMVKDSHIGEILIIVKKNKQLSQAKCS